MAEGLVRRLIVNSYKGGDKMTIASIHCIHLPVTVLLYQKQSWIIKIRYEQIIKFKINSLSTVTTPDKIKTVLINMTRRSKLVLMVTKIKIPHIGVKLTNHSWQKIFKKA